MAQSEQQVQLQYLEEALESLNQIESGLMGLSNSGGDRQRMDSVLRAAHSIKGGAALMEFHCLSRLAHRMEDFFKVLKVGRVEADAELERSLLSGIDQMREVVTLNQKGIVVEEDWVQEHAVPIFEHLHDRLGDPQPEDEAALLSEEAGDDMVALLFDSEVEATLQRLEDIYDSNEKYCLAEEVKIAAAELADLAVMLDLQAFNDLCQSVLTHLEATSNPSEQEAISQVALEHWRRSQAMVMIGQRELLPTVLEISTPVSQPAVNSSVLAMEEPPAISDLESISLLTDEQSEISEQELHREEDLDRQVLQEIYDSPNVQNLFADLEPFTPELEIRPADEPPVPAIMEETLSLNIAQSFSETRTENSQIEPTLEVKEQTLRVSVSQLDQLDELFGELVIERNGLAQQLKRIRELMGLMDNRVLTLEASNHRLRSAYDKVATQTSGGQASLATGSALHDEPISKGLALSEFGQSFDLLEMDRYSEIHLLSQEFMETAVQIKEVSGDINTNLGDAELTTRTLTRTTKQLQTSMTQVRMRPISDLLSRFPRILRDMSLQYGKDVVLEINGGSTLIDRSILDALNDPLIHLIRNAFDHGIEDPETRCAQGKSAIGTISIKAAYRGRQTMITISDDGAGINLEKIRQRAIIMGIDDSILDSASSSELLDLIFEPGFTTAAAVTDLSGRGVGMDVVRTNLKSAKGTITVDTWAGQGTTFTIAVPFTLSVIRVLLVESGQSLFAFPTDAIEEMITLEEALIYKNSGTPVLEWAGKMVPLLSLQDYFRYGRPTRIPDTEDSPTINQPLVLMIANGDEVSGIQVDRFWGQQEVTIRQAEGQIPLSKGFAGCTIMGNGQIVPLIDTLGLLHGIADTPDPASSLANQPLQDYQISDAQPAIVEHHSALVMVVDDSINVRRFLAATLEKVGYRVEQARDGQHAIEKLQMNLPIQAVICDIEMPRLDGYGFLAHARALPMSKQLPILMLTSRSGSKHRQLAMSLGATDYFSKPFREKELLARLENCIKVPQASFS